MPVVRNSAAAALVVCAPLLAASCQVLFGIEEKRFVESSDAGTLPETGSPDAGDASDATADQAVVPETGDPWSRTPPPRPEGDAAPSQMGKNLTFAMRRLFLGSIDPETDESDPNAWRKMGYDIDGMCTTPDESKNRATGVCAMQVKAGDYSQEDGDDCRDNAGGHILAEAFKLLSLNYEKLTHAQTMGGEVASLVLQIDDLDNGPDDPHAPAKLYVSAPRMPGDLPPLWDGKDKFRIDDRSVIDGGIQVPKVAFLKGYMKDHVWVSDDFGSSPMMLPLPLFGDFTFVEARTATLSLRFNESHSKVISSVLMAVTTMPTIEQAVWPGILWLTSCNQPVAEGMLSAAVRPNTDLADKPPKFLDPAADCTLLSVGLAPEWMLVQPPGAVVVAPPVPPPCDGGTTDGSD